MTRLTAAEKQRRHRAKPGVLEAEREKARAYRAANLERVRANALRYYHANRDRICMKKRADRYGLTAEEFEALWASQGARCGICKSDLASQKRVHVDHDHATGRIRGILCFTCNVGIGMLGDDPRVLRSALLWLD